MPAPVTLFMPGSPPLPVPSHMLPPETPLKHPCCCHSLIPAQAFASAVSSAGAEASASAIATAISSGQVRLRCCSELGVCVPGEWASLLSYVCCNNLLVSFCMVSYFLLPCLPALAAPQAQALVTVVAQAAAGAQATVVLDAFTAVSGLNVGGGGRQA